MNHHYNKMDLPTEIWDMIEEYEDMYAQAQHEFRYQNCLETIKHIGVICPYYESLKVYPNCLDLVISLAERDLGFYDHFSQNERKRCIKN